MYPTGLAFVMIGLLAEAPQGLASMGIVGTLRPGSLPGNEITHDLVLLGFVLCAYGLFTMARAKGWQGWVSVLGITGVPGTLLGLIIVRLIKARAASGTMDSRSLDEQHN